jgi:hypothetical protein
MSTALDDYRKALRHEFRDLPREDRDNIVGVVNGPNARRAPLRFRLRRGQTGSASGE